MTETDTSRERLERLQSIGCADYLHIALLARAEKAEGRARHRMERGNSGGD